MSKQVLGVHQMQHLQELGLKLDYNTLLSWIVDNRGKDKTLLCISSEAVDYVDFSHYCLPAYTLQDVLELLPHIDGCQLSLGIDCDPKMIWYEDVKSLDESGYETDGTISFIGDTMLEVAYKSLVWAIKEGYLETDKRKQL